MKLSNIILIGLALCYSVGIAAAAPGGVVNIINDVPALQFECTYKIGQEIYGPIIISPTQKIPLGPVDLISDVIISRYGQVAGIGAKHFSYANQLAICKQRPDQNCVLHIIPSLTKIWDVTTAVTETQVKQEKIDKPIEYFTKAVQKGAKVEPRHILDLGEPYTAKQVDEQQKRLQAQIQHSEYPIDLREQILKILNAAASYAKLLLSYPAQSTIIMAAFHGKLHPELVKNGSKIACSLFTGTVLPRMDQRTYLDAIIDLMWFYYDMAIQKNQPFLEGTFVLQDQGGRIFDFLFNYVQMVNPDALKATPSLKNPSIQFAYPRLSTHFRDEQEKYRQYGIDIRFGKPGTKFTTASIGSAQFLLPTQKSHLIFGKLSDGFVYIKMEVFGTCPDQFVEHGKDYIGSLVRKIKPSLMPYLNKYAPTRVNNLVEYYIETDDEPYYRKEHVPQAVLAYAFENLQRANLPAEQMQQIILEFARGGIHGILDEINNARSPLQQTQKDVLKQYLANLKNNEGLDHQEIRRGREVIITNIELTQRCLEAMKL